MKILLIAGHGAGDPGATSVIGGVSYWEAEETRAVVADLAEDLRGAAEVRVYDTSRNAYTDYQNGTLPSLAQFSNYDYVLEIHFNSFRPDSGDGKVKGSEIYVTPQESGIQVELDILRHLAAIGFTDRGVKRRSNLAVINQARRAGVSAALLEVCFLDDADDMRLYTAGRGAIARAVAAGIREGFGLEEREMTRAEARAIIRDKAGLEEKTLNFLDSYIWRDDLMVKLARAMK